MKKILALLGVVTLTTTAAASVVSCSARVNPIKVHPTNAFDAGDDARTNLDGDSNNAYDLGQFENATTSALPFSSNNLAQLFQPVAQQGNRTVNNDLFNVLAYSHRKVVKPNNNQKQLREYRNQLAGREDFREDNSLPEKERYIRPSVDGVYMPHLESDQATLDKYYAAYKTTTVNSIEGLYNLAQYKPSNGVALSESLARSKAMADANFAYNENADYDSQSAGWKFAQLFLGLTKNPAREAAFTDVSYNRTNNINEVFEENPTRVTTFNQTGDSSTLTPNDINIAYNDAKANTKAADHTDQEKFRFYERKDVDPFNRVVLKSSATKVAAAPTTLVDRTSLIKEDDRKNWDKAWSEFKNLIQLNSTSEVYFYDQGKDGKHDWRLVPRQFYYEPVIDLDLQYKFNTNARHHDKGQQYLIDFKLKNLHAVWEPVMTQLQLKDSSDDDKKNTPSQVTWVFRGYKFSRGVDASLQGLKADEVVSVEDNEKLTFELQHRFMDLEFSDLKVSEE